MAAHSTESLRMDDTLKRRYASHLSQDHSKSPWEPWKGAHGTHNAHRKRLQAVADQVLRKEGEFPIPYDLLLPAEVEVDEFDVLSSSVTSI